uniref:Spindle assembly abnormal protein 6 homolog isoform X2 n=1 Tax=Dermatophagoides pteronyssinus TaxID=6956 RepID=A0A6P6XWB4_DERPT|nr:spindle assembly abnormal protein 6 homolog isoform X2 [Dermatophagoides pteronyssinus]
MSSNHQHLNGDDFRSRTSGGSSGLSYSSIPTHLHALTSCSNTVQANPNAPNIAFSRLVTFHLQESTNFSINKTIQLLLEVDSRFNEIREEISVRILDPNDPFFIYLYPIDFNEYKSIKQTQNLLVSFEKFSDKLINMFEKCSISTPSSATSTRTSGILHSDNGSSYILCIRNLSRTMLTLDIVELNEFKNIVHLSFEIPSASEEFVRSNFCTIYRKSKSEIETLQMRISSLEDQLSTMTIVKSNEVRSLKLEFDMEKKSIQEKLKDVEQKFSQEQTKWNDVERVLKSKCQKLQTDLKNREETIEIERKEHERQYHEWKEKLNEEVVKRHNKLKELDERNQQLNAEVGILKIEKEQTNQIMVKNETEIGSIRKDLIKANEIIRKLQNEVKSCQEKINTLNEVTEKQEEIVSIKESTIERLSLDLKLCLQQLKSKEKEIDRLKSDYERQKCHCSQLELQLTSSKKIIANMNKELDQLKLQKKTHDNNKMNKCPTQAMRRSKTAENLSEIQTQSNSNRVEFDPDKINGGRSKKSFLFTNTSRELPLKTVNLRTTKRNHD